MRLPDTACLPLLDQRTVDLLVTDPVAFWRGQCRRWMWEIRECYGEMPCRSTEGRRRERLLWALDGLRLARRQYREAQRNERI